MMSSLTMKVLVNRPQGAAQEFAIGPCGQGRDVNIATRGFVTREAFARESVERCGVERVGASIEGHYDACILFHLDIGDGDLRDAGMRSEGGLDLKRRDTKAACIHHVV